MLVQDIDLRIGDRAADREGLLAFCQRAQSMMVAQIVVSVGP